MDHSGIVLLGGGGHALVVADAAEGVGLVVSGCLDDDAVPVLAAGPGAKPHLGPISAVARLGKLSRFVLAFGSIEGRRRVIESGSVAADRFISICHSMSCVARDAKVGPGSFVGARAIVNPRAVVGAHAIINTGAIVEHECEIGQNVHVAPGAVLGGRVRIGNDTLIGIGARVIPGVKIGSGVTVGAGAVVIRDVANGTRVVGCPARAMCR